MLQPGWGYTSHIVTNHQVKAWYRPTALLYTLYMLLCMTRAIVFIIHLYTPGQPCNSFICLCTILFSP